MMGIIFKHTKMYGGKKNCTYLPKSNDYHYLVTFPP